MQGKIPTTKTDKVSNETMASGNLPSTVSLYLDLVRFLAAVCVFVTHAKYHRFTNGWLDGIGRYGSDAVMIFFVLSGLVIAHVTQTKERNIESYAISRLARLWSVALPALLLSVIADSIGIHLYPSMYDGLWYQGDQATFRLLINAVFQGQSWFMNVLPFTNTPYWSLGYEFWYYAIFAVGHFLHGSIRWTALAVCCALCGPKILLLMPIWLMGIAVYRIMQTYQIPLQVGWLLWIGSFFGYGLFQAIGMPGYLLWRSVKWLGEPFVIDSLLWSKDFLGNYFVGILVAANFIGFWRIHKTFDYRLHQLQRPIRFMAGFTFSVYLFHMPLLHFFGAVIKHDASSPASQFFILLMTMVGIFLLGLITEQKKAFTKRIVATLFHKFVRRNAT